MPTNRIGFASDFVLSNGLVGIGTTNSTQKLHVQGNVRVTGGLYDSNNNVGTAGSVLSSTGSGLSWISPSGGGSSSLYYRIGTAYTGANSTTAQSSLGVSVTVASSTIYDFEGIFGIAKTTAPTANTNFSLLFGGTATIHNIIWTLVWETVNGTYSSTTQKTDTVILQATTAYQIGSIATTDTNLFNRIYIRGTVNINAGGTFAPQYQLSATGGAFTTALGSYFKMTPLTISSGSGASAIASSGTWA